ncbi:hypothetical protein Tco_0281661 [Tanacetum coccineum]
MANLEFYDKYNMVAYLKKPNKSEGFQEIADFLNGSHIRFALTKNPTIYVSLFEKFWPTATVRIVDNGEQEITATVDGKEFTITEASVRRHLQLADVHGVNLINQRKRYFAAHKSEAKRNKPMTQAQQRNYMMNYIKHMGSHTVQQLKRYSFDELKELFETTMKNVNAFIPMETEDRERASELAAGSSQATITDSAEVRSSKRAVEVGLDHEGSKKQKTNEDSESVQEQPDEEEKELPKWISKMMIVSSQSEEVMLKYRDDLVKLWDLVKEGFSRIEPIDDKKKELWVELKRLFEPDSDDTLWKLQRYMHDPLVWRLYVTCGFSPCNRQYEDMISFMLVEKDYPLSKGVQMFMLATKLLVEQHSEMANELLRKIFIQATRSKQ